MRVVRSFSYGMYQSPVVSEPFPNANIFINQLGKPANETRKIIENANKWGLDRLNVLERYKLFGEDRKQVEDNQHPGRPSTTKYDENTVNA